MRSHRRGYFRQENWAWYTLASFVIGIWCLITIVLFLNVLVSSFKGNFDILAHPWAFPATPTLANYIRLLNGGFLKYYLNSFTVLIFSIVLILCLSAPAAYGLGKFKFRGNQFLRVFFLVGLMFPVQLGIIPLFNLLNLLHLVNTLWGIILINAAGLSVPVFVLTNFTKNIPDAFREAAWMDGASEFKIFTIIFLPLMRPALGALIPLTAVGIWNDFFVPLVFISDDNIRTIPLGLLKYFLGKGFTLQSLGLQFAAMALSVFPLLFLYLLGSRNIIGGLTQGGLKA